MLCTTEHRKLQKICLMLLNFDKNNSLSFSERNISLALHLLMGIYSHRNKGHSHSRTCCFPFLPIPILNFVLNSHSHGIPIPIGNPTPVFISSQ